ncbi:MAG: protein translocase subunit SecF [Ruminococcaceae bacterium]|nr:protein translocase subunit SecF [Oscillospiraceae bacterium]
MFKIVEKSKLSFAVSAIVILIGVIGLVINHGFTLSVDFAGGLNMYVDMSAYVNKGNEIDLEGIAKVVQDNTPENVQPSVLRSDSNQIVIKTVSISDQTELENMKKALLETYSLDETAILQIDNIDATVGKELSSQALTATLIASVLMLLYITIRFEFKTGVSAIICLLHDVLIMMSFYAVFKIPIDTNFIAAVLTIIGYSINNTIVVFDRIRENYSRAKRSPFADTVNKSIKQTLGRSINTTITTLLPVVMLCLLGVTSIRQFAITIIVGLIAGTYSSVFLAGSIWAWLKGIQDNMKKKKIAKRA